MNNNYPLNINFNIIQEIPYSDPYNYKYEKIEKNEKLIYLCESNSNDSSSDESNEDELNENSNNKNNINLNESNNLNYDSNSSISSNKSYDCINYLNKSNNLNKFNKSDKYTKIYKNNEINNTNKKNKYENEFIKQCEFSNDGLCYYTISNGNYLKLYYTDFILLNFFEINKNIIDNNINNINDNITNDNINNLNDNITNDNINNLNDNVDIKYNFLLNDDKLKELNEMYNNMNKDDELKIKTSWINMKLREHIYDCKFYPFFDWNNYNTCFFSVCSKNKPVNIYSVFDKSILLSFKTLNESYELQNTYSLCFHPEKNWLLCGMNKCIQVFDLYKPSDVYEKRILSTRKGNGQKGIISCISYKSEGYGKNTIYCVSDYSDDLYLYADNCNHKNDYIIKYSCKNNSNGITHVKWFDEYYILSGSRNSSYIYLFDIRNEKNHVSKFQRISLTNQKYSFDVYKKKYLICGDTFGYINIYDILKQELICKKNINKYSPIIAVNVHNKFPILLTCSGTRRYYQNNNCDIDLFNNVYYKNKYNEFNCMSESNQYFLSVSKYINSVCTIILDL